MFYDIGFTKADCVLSQGHFLKNSYRERRKKKRMRECEFIVFSINTVFMTAATVCVHPAQRDGDLENRWQE